MSEVDCDGWHDASEELAQAPEPIKWKKLERPQVWKPSEGEEAVGYYLGTSTREGMFGQYKVAMIAVPKGDGFSHPLMVSGVQVIQALEGGVVKQGAFIRISFVGFKDLGEGRTMKMMDVYEAEGSITIEQAQEYLEFLRLDGSAAEEESQ